MNSSSKARLNKILHAIPILDLIPLIQKWWRSASRELPSGLLNSIDQLFEDPNSINEKRVDIIKASYIKHFLENVFAKTHFGAIQFSLLETTALQHRVLKPESINSSNSQSSTRFHHYDLVSKYPQNLDWKAFVNPAPSSQITPQMIPELVNEVGVALSKYSYNYFITGSFWNSQVWIRVGLYDSKFFYTGTNSPQNPHKSYWPFNFSYCSTANSDAIDLSRVRKKNTVQVVSKTAKKRGRATTTTSEYECATNFKSLWFVHWPCSRLLMLYISQSKRNEDISVIQTVSKVIFKDPLTRVQRWKLSGERLLSLSDKFFNSKSRGIEQLIEQGLSTEIANQNEEEEEEEELSTWFSNKRNLESEIVNSTELHSRAIKTEIRTVFGDSPLPILNSVTFEQKTKDPINKLKISFHGPHVLGGIKECLDQGIMNYPVPNHISDLVTGNSNIVEIKDRFDGC